MHVVRTTCPRDCPDTCFIDVTVDEGKLIKIKGSTLNPVTRGFLCPRGAGDIQRAYSRDRVLYPHRRSNRGPARFVRVTWDDALSTVSENLTRTVKVNGNDSLLLYDYCGNQGLLAWQFPRRLWFALGATTTDYSLCSTSGHAGIGLHYGLGYGLQPEELAKMKVIIFWGNNARVSSPHIWVRALKARSNGGATIISVDPRKSPTSEAADIWMNPRPGTDVALSYGIARHLIRRDGVDLEFINRCTTGYREYLEEALKWTPELVERCTGVSWSTVEKVSDLLIADRPAAFMIGLGLQKSMQGAEAARGVSLLPALLGYHRGFHYSDSKARFIDWDYLNGSALSRNSGRVVNQVSIGERLEAGEFKFVYVLGTNPAITLPNQSAVRKGLKREDVFVVVEDTHWSESTVYADVVLPAATYLEKTDIHLSDHHPYCRVSGKAIEPIGESRHEIWVMQELARRLGLREKWLFEDPWEGLQRTLKDSLKEGDLSAVLGGSILQLKSRARNEYQTPSGKIEFAASHASATGAGELPRQEITHDEDRGFVLLNSSIPKYTHSQFIDVYGPIPRIIWMNPEDAKRLGIRNGEVVEIFNRFGSVLLEAELTDKVSTGVLWAPRPLIGLNGSPLNVLIPGTSQKIGGGPVFNSAKVHVKRIPDSGRALVRESSPSCSGQMDTRAPTSQEDKERNIPRAS